MLVELVLHFFLANSYLLLHIPFHPNNNNKTVKYKQIKLKIYTPYPL